ncbi:MAG: polymorphic toxin type 46 domain-containing protein, partial [Byssovorax sp.]
MSALEAARLGDQIGHTSAMKGLIAGLVIGFIVTAVVLVAVGATVATGGAAAVVIGALIAGTAGGGLAGMKIGATFDSDPKGPIHTGSPNTFLGTGRKPAARATLDTVLCADHTLKLIAQGSTDVFINNVQAARRTDMTVCSAKIREGQPDVFFGGPTGTYLDMEAEVPGLLVSILEWAALLGAVVATGGAILTVGIGAALLGLGGSLLGGWIGGKAGAMIGGYFGEKGAAIGEVAGGFFGSMFGGGLGAKGGARLEAKLPTSTLARLPGSSPAKIAARQQVARDHYSSQPDFIKNGSPNVSRIESHMSGIDFTKPVSVRTVQQRTTLTQFQNKDGTTGNYVARAGTKPTELGIGDMGRAANGTYGPKMVQRYDVPAGTKVLVSTASPKNDNFGVGASETAPGSGVYYRDALVQPSTGGKQQIMVGNSSVLVRNGVPTQANPSLLSPNTPTTFQPAGPTTTVKPVWAPNPPTVPVRGDGVHT